MTRKVEVPWKTLRMIAHSLMVRVQVSEAYIHFSLMYTEDHIFLVLPIKDMINKDYADLYRSEDLSKSA